MTLSSHPFGCLRLTTLLLLIASLLSLSFAAPLAGNQDVEHASTLVRRTREESPDSRTSSERRAGPRITQAEYEAYLERYYHPATGGSRGRGLHYLQYTGYALGQLKGYQRVNPDSVQYDDLFDAQQSQYYSAVFGNRPENGEAASRAMSVVNGKYGKVMRVFGSLDYKKWKNTMYYIREAATNLMYAQEGSSYRIYHMADDATAPDDIAAMEDSKNGMRYRSPYKAGDSTADPEFKSLPSSVKSQSNGLSPPGSASSSPKGSRRSSPKGSKKGSPSRKSDSSGSTQPDMSGGLFCKRSPAGCDRMPNKGWKKGGDEPTKPGKPKGGGTGRGGDSRKPLPKVPTRPPR